MDLNRNSDVSANTEKDLASRDWDDEINLQKVVSVVAAWWREIVLGVFLAAIMGGVAINVLEIVLPRYEASTNVVIIHDATRSDRNPVGQRAALVGLIHHESVAKRVLERLRLDGLLEESRYTAEMLFKAISAELVTVGSVARQNQSDLIRINAKGDSLEKAMAIANAWTEEYMIEINRQHEQESLVTTDKIQTSIDRTLNSLEDAQRELEQMIRESRIDQIKRQIQINKWNIRQLHDIRHRVVATMLHRQVDSQLDLLDQHYDIQLRLNELLGVAESLRAQIESSGEAGAASNELAIMLFKVHAYAVTGDLPNKLEIGFDNTRTAYANVADQIADMDAVIAALRDRIDRINRDIARQSNSLPTRLLNIEVAEEGDLPIQFREEEAQGAPDFSSGSLLQFPELKDYTELDEGLLMRHIEKIEDRTRLLEMQLEAQIFKRDNLARVRNRARSHLDNLLNENDKMILENTISRPVLRLASSAATEGESLWPSTSRIAAASGAAGLLVVVLLVFFMHSLGVRPFLKKRGTEHTIRARDP